MAATTTASTRTNSSALFHVYASGQSNADLSAYPTTVAGEKARCPDAFTPQGVGTIVVKRQVDDGTETFTSWPAGKTLLVQCSALVSTTVDVLFQWAGKAT